LGGDVLKKFFTWGADGSQEEGEKPTGSCMKRPAGGQKGEIAKKKNKSRSVRRPKNSAKKSNEKTRSGFKQKSLAIHTSGGVHSKPKK